MSHGKRNVSSILVLLVTTSLASHAYGGQQAKLLADDAEAGDRFGWSVAISGDTLIVGAYQDDDACPTDVNCNSGSVYVFIRTGSTWTKQAKLTASDAQADDGFGWSVAIDGDTVLIGAFGDDDVGFESGSTYVFTRTRKTWSQQAKLVATDGSAGDNLGFSVSVHGNTALVSALGGDDSCPSDVNCNSGSAYVFTRTGTTWTQQGKLNASDAAMGDFFGISASISGDTAIVGAHFNDDACPLNTNCNSGSAYIFTRTGTTWTQQTKLIASDASFFDTLGWSVSISGDTALVSARLDDDACPLDVNCNSGSVYVFTRSGSAWTQQTKLTASDATTGDLFGNSVSINIDTALIGASLDDDAGVAAGSGYVFARAGSSWTQQSKLIAPDAKDGDRLGTSVSISSGISVLGAYSDTGPAGTLQGSARVFTALACAADLNGDGTVDGADLGLLLGNWAGAGSGDINNSGATDGADLGLLLGAWGACP